VATMTGSDLTRAFNWEGISTCWMSLQFYNFVIATTEFSDIHYTPLHIAIKPRANMAKHISLTHGI